MDNLFQFEFGGATVEWYYKKFAPLSDSAIFAKWGGTSLNVSILRGEGEPSMDFFPLQVEYLERMYAIGKISSSPYVKREGHPSDAAILKGRIIDRAIRPRFPEGLVDTVQIYVNVFSFDKNYDPLILSFNTIVAGLMASSIKFNGPLSALRISLNEANNLIVNNHAIPLWDANGVNETEKENMNMVISVDRTGVVMFDAGMNEIVEDKVKEGMRFAIEQSEPIFKAQEEFAKKFGIEKKEGVVVTVPEDLITKIKSNYGEEIEKTLSNPNKEERLEQMDSLQDSIKETILEEKKDSFETEADKKTMEGLISRAIAKVFKKYVRKFVIEENKRLDGRDFDEVRPLNIEVGAIPRVHGSGMFMRGETQVLTIATLDSLQKQLQIEEMTGDEERSYIHEYYSPPYAFGQPGRIRYYPGRREVGHGALAEKALLPVLPSKEEFPYTIRLVSEVLSSAGSTSMASTCASTLALMDAGVPIKKPVAGISVGVIMDNNDTSKFKLLTDIQELEDFYGEMDFKVAGTKDGITAIQMDQKRGVLPVEVFDQALDAAKAAREFILSKMLDVIPQVRSELSKYAPGVKTIKIDPDDIGRLIGPGGKVIKEIMKESNSEIYIEDDGHVTVSAVDQSNLEKSIAMIKEALGGDDRNHSRRPRKEYKIGEVYEVEVVDLKPFGAIVKILDGTDSTGLIHISEIADTYIKDINTVLKIGQEVRAKIIEVDDNGRIRLSIKQV